jgi:hypothetical protein
MEWISFFGPRRPINGQKVYYFGEYIGVWQGRYEIHRDDPVSEHILICEETPGIVDRMDAPWWMPYEGQPKPQRPAKDYPDDYPRLMVSKDGREIWTTEGRVGFYEE